MTAQRHSIQGERVSFVHSATLIYINTYYIHTYILHWRRRLWEISRRVVILAHSEIGSPCSKRGMFGTTCWILGFKGCALWFDELKIHVVQCRSRTCINHIDILFHPIPPCVLPNKALQNQTRHAETVWHNVWRSIIRIYYAVTLPRSCAQIKASRWPRCIYNDFTTFMRLAVDDLIKRHVVNIFERRNG